jgi:hypothetical protein
MTANQVYEQTIKPLSAREKLTIARLIIDEIALEADAEDAPQPEAGFDYLKRLLPQIERITVTEQDLAGVVLSEPNGE